MPRPLTHRSTTNANTVRFQRSCIRLGTEQFVLCQIVLHGSLNCTSNDPTM